MFVIISGTTCSGKSSIVKELKEKGFEQLITTTTRLPRKSDKLTDYEFVSPDHFHSELSRNVFLEHNQHGDHLYGVKLKEIVRAIDSGDDYVVTLDPNGHRKMKKYLMANNVPMLSAFVTAEGKTRLRRLIEREGDIDRVMERFAVMLNTEAHWFRDESEYYDMVLETDDFPIADVAGVIMQYVTARNSLSKKVV
jgi:guanylate kinase